MLESCSASVATGDSTRFMEGKKKEKQKRFEEPNLELCLKPPSGVDPINKTSILDEENTIAFVVPEIEYMKDYSMKLQEENEMLQRQLDSVTDNANQRCAQIEELKVELKRLEKLVNAQEEEHKEGESSKFYDYDETDSASTINTDQYLNFDGMNIDPTKDNM
ncbi:hypothetical protein T459_33215 [Capsicum annuum]|uniref:Uncharacterized protein n=1 Tax=Capsicum annuum TaxID=4072 RepID=A0A2G2XZL8_CAPAN|nr:hypothetical protein T459_33215 [Capsicum annuum]